MRLSADCMLCLVERQKENLALCQDEAAKADYLREVLREIANAGEGDTAPVMIARINQLHHSAFGVSYSFEGLKREYNEMLLKREAEIRERIRSSPDPLKTAVQFAMAGNYIDFGAMKQIDPGKLDRLLSGAEAEELDENVFSAFQADLRRASKLVYLTDNCGEIVLDKLLIQTIRGLYPQMEITAIVRGQPVLNDATAEDAEFVGLPAVAQVLGNGTQIAGTQLNAVSQDARQRILQADLILSKGQGNFETLQGCALNVYYLFLCKCDWFIKRFQLKRHQGVFINEKNLESRGCRPAGGGISFQNPE